LNDHLGVGTHSSHWRCTVAMATIRQ